MRSMLFSERTYSYFVRGTEGRVGQVLSSVASDRVERGLQLQDFIFFVFPFLVRFQYYSSKIFNPHVCHKTNIGRQILNNMYGTNLIKLKKENGINLPYLLNFVCFRRVMKWFIFYFSHNVLNL